MFNKGEKVKIKIPYSLGTSGNCNVWVCEFDEDLYKQGYEELNDELYNITEFNTSEISGSINVKDDGLMFTSIPYEEGWKAYVDDVEAEIVPVANNAMVALNLTRGEHKVVFRYFPKGFAASLIMFFAGIAVFAAIILFEKFYLIKKKKRGLILPIPEFPDNLLDGKIFEKEAAEIKPEKGQSDKKISKSDDQKKKS